MWEKEQKKSADSGGQGEAEMEVDQDLDATDASGKLKAVWEWFNNLTPEVVPCLCW